MPTLSPRQFGTPSAQLFSDPVTGYPVDRRQDIRKGNRALEVADQYGARRAKYGEGKTPTDRRLQDQVARTGAAVVGARATRKA